MTARLHPQPLCPTPATGSAPSPVRKLALAFFLTLLATLAWGAMHQAAHAEGADPAPSPAESPSASPGEDGADAPTSAGEPPAAGTTTDPPDEVGTSNAVDPVDTTAEPAPALAEETDEGPLPVADVDAALLTTSEPAHVDMTTVVEAAVVTPAALSTPAVHQCNADTYPTGAGWEASCEVTIENTLGSDGSTQSSITTTWCLAEAGVLPPAGCTSDVVLSDDLVTSVDQCNGILAGGSNVTCRVHVINNVPAATPTTAVTVNQCIGSGQGGVSPGGPPTDCDPVDSSTTGATVTQCNGSANGGGAPERVQCSVSGAVSALPVTVNQCNGSTAAGSTVTCEVFFTNTFAPVAGETGGVPPVTPTPALEESSRPAGFGPGSPAVFTPATSSTSATPTAASTSAGSSTSTSRTTTGPAPFGGGDTSLAMTGLATSTLRLLMIALLLLLLGSVLLAGTRRSTAGLRP